MLYYKSLIYGLSPLPPANIFIRKKIKKIFMDKGSEYLHFKLSKIDKKSSALIHPNDFKRIQRALEVFFISGKTITELKKISGNPLPYKIYQFALLPKDKSILFNNIENRLMNMLLLGFENEVKKLFDRKDLDINLPSINCIGYRQMWSYLLGNLSYHDMIQKTIFATKKLVKKQITWLKSWKDVTIINDKCLKNNCKLILHKINKKNH